jgi:glucosamine 6-phosphate synthetase-like amidotransferase/phosphosugar isomerase protein
MCNIAGYIGSKQAAPIIVEMLRKQEGWDSGYYTGIATIHDGKL